VAGRKGDEGVEEGRERKGEGVRALSNVKHYAK
jgi:hypothetical protein